MRRRTVSVIGGRAQNTDVTSLILAKAVGAEIGRRGYGLISGGDDGIAAAANAGCIEAGGQTLALLKWNRLTDCGPNVTWAIPTSMDLARSNILNWSGDGVIAFAGAFGTLGEIALALDTERPLVILGEPAYLRLPATALVPRCAVLPSPTPDDVTAILDTLEALIDTGVLPPVRPDVDPTVALR